MKNAFTIAFDIAKGVLGKDELGFEDLEIDLSDFIDKKLDLNFVIGDGESDNSELTYTFKGKDIFEKFINPMFENVKEKEGVYHTDFDEDKREVTVYIDNENLLLNDISGTGLIAGLTDLFENHDLTKIQIGNQPETDLQAVKDEADSRGFTFQESMRSRIILGLWREVQERIDDKTYAPEKLSDYKDMSLDLKLTVERGNNDPFDLIYKINVKGIDKAPDEGLEAAKEAAKKALDDAGIESDYFDKYIDSAKTIEGLETYVKEVIASHEATEAEEAAKELEEAKKAAKKALDDAGIESDYFDKYIDSAKTIEGLE
ncbi:MAG: albumin-binding GA domain-containing protein, partial [Peptoniphilaceae bacterium]|nr:albumin-binding GA domain-containing protein [Peptoniphilaceae bacterium]